MEAVVKTISHMCATIQVCDSLITYALCHRKSTAHDTCLYILILFLIRGAQAIRVPLGVEKSAENCPSRGTICVIPPPY